MRASWCLVLTQVVLARLVGQMVGYRISYQTPRTYQEIGPIFTQIAADKSDLANSEKL